MDSISSLNLTSMSFLKMTIFVITLSFFTSCSTESIKTSDIPVPKMSSENYEDLIDTHTKKDKKYEGFHNLYEVSVTLLNSEIKNAQLDRVRFFQSWNSQQFSEERSRNLQKMSHQVDFFVSYYSPQKNLRKLHSGKTPWKIYLDVNGKRYEGKINKYYNNKAQIETLFPHHSRWSKPYLITFNIPTEGVEATKSKFIFTSSAGKSIFEF